MAAVIDVPEKAETPQEKADKEIAAQKEDLEKARVEAKNAGQDPDGDLIITEGLPEPYTAIRRYRGVGPLAYETKRGLIKVNSGDLIIEFLYHRHDPVTGEDLPDEKEYVVMTEEAFKAIAPAVPPPPEALDVRANVIGRKRRGEKAPEKKKLEAPKAPEVKK